MTVPVVRAAEAGDLEALQGVFLRASLHNAGDREVLLAHPEVLVWSGEAIAGGRVRVAVEGGTVVGFATTVPIDGGLELDSQAHFGSSRSIRPVTVRKRSTGRVPP